MQKREHAIFLFLLRKANVVDCSIFMNQHLPKVRQSSMRALPFINFSGIAWWEDASKVFTREISFDTRKVHMHRRMAFLSMNCSRCIGLSTVYHSKKR